MKILSILSKTFSKPRALPPDAVCSNLSPETAQLRDRSLQPRHSPSSRAASRRSHSQHSLYSKRFAAPRFQSRQTLPLSPLPAYRKLSHRNEWRSLSVSFIFRHHIFAATENVAHHSFLWH